MCMEYLSYKSKITSTEWILKVLPLLDMFARQYSEHLYMALGYKIIIVFVRQVGGKIIIFL